MYHIAIPSYNRAEILIKKTLHTLRNIPNHIITIFVANDEEYIFYSNIIKDYKIVIGKLGITQQRIFIKNYYEEGQYVVSIDDDIEEIYTLDGDKLTPLLDINLFIENAFNHLIDNNLFIWGIYPVKNPFFMKNTITTKLTFIIGTFYGFIVRHNKELEPICKEKEDYEQSILYYLKDGGVVRYNFISLKTKYKAKGGLGLVNTRYEANEEASIYLSNTYPQFVSAYKKKEMYQLRFKR
jgi:hypothetical protein